MILLCSSNADARGWFHWPWYSYHHRHHHVRYHYHQRPVSALPQNPPDQSNLIEMRHKLDDAGRIIQEGPHQIPPK